MTFAEQLKAERERLGLTQVEMSAALSVKYRTYQDWENDVTTPHEITQEGALNRLKRKRGYIAKIPIR